MVNLEEMIRRSAVRKEEQRVGEAFYPARAILSENWSGPNEVELQIGQNGVMTYFMRGSDIFVRFRADTLIDEIVKQITPIYVERAKDQAVVDFFEKVQRLELTPK